MNTLEDRLRDAYQAAAQTVQPESVLAGGARLPHDRNHGTRRAAGQATHGRRLLIPFAAAAAVIAVVAGSTMLAQHTVAGPGGHRAEVGPATAAAVAGNGRTIAYDAQPGCPSGQHAQHQDMAYLAVVNTTTGHTKRWPFVNGPGVGGVSLSADGQEVSLGDRVLPTGAPGGNLTSRGRLVATQGEFGHSTAVDGVQLAPDGRSAYFSTFRVRDGNPAGTFPTRNNKPAGDWQLRVFDRTTGHTHLVRSFPGTQASMAAVAAGPSGRYLLIEYLPHPWDGITRLARLDVATGKLTQLNASWAVEAAIAW